MNMGVTSYEITIQASAFWMSKISEKVILTIWEIDTYERHRKRKKD